MRTPAFFDGLLSSAFDVDFGERPEAQRRFDWTVAAILIIGAIIIVSYSSFGKVEFFDDHFASHFDGRRWHEMYGYLYWFLSSLVWLFALPILVIVLFPGLRVRDFGLGLGDWRYGARAALCLYGIMVPLLALVSFRPNFVDYYPMSDWVRDEIGLFADGGGAAHFWPFIVYEVSYALYFVGWEFFHRGFLTVGLSRVFGWYAIFIVTVPFAILHLNKPMPEAYGAIVASVVLGWLAIRTRSSWWGFGVHASVAVTMDVFAVLHQV